MEKPDKYVFVVESDSPVVWYKYESDAYGLGQNYFDSRSTCQTWELDISKLQDKIYIQDQSQMQHGNGIEHEHRRKHVANTIRRSTLMNIVVKTMSHSRKRGNQHQQREAGKTDA